MAVSCINGSVIVDLAMGETPRFTERISGDYYNDSVKVSTDFILRPPERHPVNGCCQYNPCL